jgi:hypothetical protein
MKLAFQGGGTVERVIGLQLAKDPLARDEVGVSRRRHELSSVIAGRVRYSMVITSSQLGSLRAAHADVGATCRLSHDSSNCRGFVETNATGVAYMRWLTMMTLERLDEIST